MSSGKSQSLVAIARLKDVEVLFMQEACCKGSHGGIILGKQHDHLTHPTPMT
jgi:hypothetical protein